VDALLERDSDLAALDGAIERMGRGEGQALLITGPAGIGKSALLAAALERARSRGAAVVTARGGELETELPLGVVRQLFERLIASATPAERERLLAGAAELVAPVFAAGAYGGRQARGEAVMHGLYWLVSNLAADASLVVAIDDIHWADSASLRFVSYLVRRLAGLPVLVVMCARSDEPLPAGSDLAHVLADDQLERVEPQPLSESGVAALVANVLKREPDRSFAAACRHATAGTPFLVRALVADLHATGVEPTTASVSQIGEIGPAAVGQATLLRLARLHPAATRLVQAIAVLGSNAGLPRVAKLAAIDPDQAMTAIDALVAAQIIERGPSLAFVHPILRTAVYRGLAAGERSLAHLQAAELLAEEGFAADVVASQLLATEPAGRPEVIDRLRSGARDAVVRGAPETAVAFLRRALAEEPNRAVRAELLYELGAAENMVRRADCIVHLDEARRMLDDPAERGACTLLLGNVLTWTGRSRDGLATLLAGIDDATAAGVPIALRLMTAYISHGMYFPHAVADVDRLIGAVRAEVVGGRASPESLIELAVVDVMRGGDIDAAVALLDRALDGGRLVARLGAESDALTAALVALAFADELDRAEALLATMAEDARRRGSVSGFLVTCGLRLCVLWRRGDVAGADDLMRRTLALAQEHELTLPIVFTLYYGIDALTERDGLAEIADQAMTLKLPPALAATVTGAWLEELRARLLLARGDRRGAADLLSPCEPIYARTGLQPSASSWRSLLALACAPEQPERARALANSELSDARRVRRPRAIGIALRRLALVEQGDAGIELLHEADAVLRGSIATLEHARALVELGSALRRANQRAAAREPLREGLDLAHRCGATRLAERAHTELRATGARPRRQMLTGRDALTPSEQRIAELAACGMSNPAIAQSLFVTTKTIENQLGRVYKKLAITSRTELPDALRPQPRQSAEQVTTTRSPAAPG
jgi:DNA-binding CsgD family transcriptional regulator